MLEPGRAIVVGLSGGRRMVIHPLFMAWNSETNPGRTIIRPSSWSANVDPVTTTTTIDDFVEALDALPIGNGAGKK